MVPAKLRQTRHNEARPSSFENKASCHVKGKLKYVQGEVWKYRKGGVAIIQATDH